MVMRMPRPQRRLETRSAPTGSTRPKQNRIALRAFLSPKTTVWQYTHGGADTSSVSPDGYTSLDPATTWDATRKSNRTRTPAIWRQAVGRMGMSQVCAFTDSSPRLTPSRRHELAETQTPNRAIVTGEGRC